MDWESAFALDEADLLAAPLTLSRNVSDAFASFAGTDDEGDEEEDLDEVLKALGGGGSEGVLPVADSPCDPASLSYSSSDDSASLTDAHSGSNSSTDGEAGEKKPKKKSVTRGKRQSTGLSAQEKRELRKLRNRELAAESRKRKNDEMERLRDENTQLKMRVAELEKQLNAKPSLTIPGSNKRTRVGTAISTAVAVASLAVFVVTGPSESQSGLSGTASVLITALDSCDRRVGGVTASSIGQFFFTFVLATIALCVLASAVFRVLQVSVSSFPFKLASSVDKLSLPRRVSSLTISNSV